MIWLLPVFAQEVAGPGKPDRSDVVNALASVICSVQREPVEWEAEMGNPCDEWKGPTLLDAYETLSLDTTPEGEAMAAYASELLMNRIGRWNRFEPTVDFVRASGATITKSQYRIARKRIKAKPRFFIAVPQRAGALERARYAAAPQNWDECAGGVFESTQLVRRDSMRKRDDHVVDRLDDLPVQSCESEGNFCSPAWSPNVDAVLFENVIYQRPIGAFRSQVYLEVTRPPEKSGYREQSYSLVAGDGVYNRAKATIGPLSVQTGRLTHDEGKIVVCNGKNSRCRRDTGGACKSGWCILASKHLAIEDQSAAEAVIIYNFLEEMFDEEKYNFNLCLSKLEKLQN